MHMFFRSTQSLNSPDTLLSTTLDGMAAKETADVRHSSGDPSANLAQNQISLQSIAVVFSYIPFIEDSRLKIEADMEQMVMEGLAEAVSLYF